MLQAALTPSKPQNHRASTAFALLLPSCFPSRGLRVSEPSPQGTGGRALLGAGTLVPKGNLQHILEPLAQ